MESSLKGKVKTQSPCSSKLDPMASRAYGGGTNRAEVCTEVHMPAPRALARDVDGNAWNRGAAQILVKVEGNVR